jgi:ribosomal protein S27AE
MSLKSGVSSKSQAFDSKLQTPDSFIMSEENPLAIDVETHTTRGRSCPRCGGKIIPSDRAVYQNTGDPSAVFAIWQCERCGYEEMSERSKPEGKTKH